MREHIRASAVANRVRMLPHAGAFLLVEGWDDARLYGAFVDRSSCKLIIAHGKPNALDAVASLRANGPRAVLAILDADFMILEGAVPVDPAVLLTDLHDLEAMLVASPALERVLQEYGHAEEGAQTTHAVRLRLIDLGRPLGYLRWLSHRERLGLLFDGMSFDRFVNVKTLELRRDSLLAELQTRSRKGALDGDDIWTRVEALARDEHDPWHVCCGHDLVALLALGLRRVWGTNLDAAVPADGLERSLRLAYQATDFGGTQLYARLRAWEATNPPYRVLKDT